MQSWKNQLWFSITGTDTVYCYHSCPTNSEPLFSMTKCQTYLWCLTYLARTTSSRCIHLVGGGHSMKLRPRPTPRFFVQEWHFLRSSVAKQSRNIYTGWMLTFVPFVLPVPVSKLLAFWSRDVDVVRTVHYCWDRALRETEIEMSKQCSFNVSTHFFTEGRGTFDLRDPSNI